MNITQNDHGGLTYAATIRTSGDQRCDLLASVRMLLDTYADLADAVRRQHGDQIPPDLQLRLTFGTYMIERLRGGELAQLARICNASR